MATALQLRFPGRRYHATPWSHHVNEGVVEWPPSPWRLLRALLSTGFTKLGWAPDGPPLLARRLIERLAASNPEYVLPPATLAHSRHYVDAAGKKPLILDTWANVEDGVIEVRWDVDLDPDQRALLGELAQALGYLGRAESWVEARLAPADAPPIRAGVRCRATAGGPPAPGWEPVRVRCPVSAEAYDLWRQRQLVPILAEHGATEGRRLSAAQQKKLEKAMLPYPRDLVAALCAETANLQAQGWSEPPGSEERVYYRPVDALSVSVPVAPRVSPPISAPFALLSLSTASRGQSALPPVQRVFPQGRLLHTALASVVGHQLGGDPAVAACLLGKVGDQAADGDHQHAHLLHLDLGGSQRLDHVLVFAPMGLDARALEALARLQRTYMKGGAGELQVALAGWGDHDALRAMPDPVGAALRRVVGPAEGARVWESATPYVAPRLLKKRGRDSLEGLIEGECARRGLPPLERIERLEPSTEDPVQRGFRSYPLHDARHHPPYAMGYALRLVFTEPCHGPVCLGYGAHAGLGRFSAAS